MFYSVRKEWESSSRDNMGDVRELIPEFFYLPDFLLNSNHIQLGRSHHSSSVHCQKSLDKYGYLFSKFKMAQISLNSISSLLPNIIKIKRKVSVSLEVASESIDQA